MPLVQADVFGSPNMGVYCFTNESLCLVPYGLMEGKMNRFGDCLDVTVQPLSICESILLGIFITGNSSGLALPRTVRPHEIERIRSLTDMNLTVLKTKWTALGNLILANDNGALVDPRFTKKTLDALSHSLGVEVVKGEINGLPYIGSLAVATNNGVITHTGIKDDERRLVEEVLHVPTEAGTVNNGVPYPSSGMLVNSKGAVVGPLTTGIELAAITRTMQI